MAEGELTVDAVVELPTGVKCDLSDGAMVRVTTDGAWCSRCLRNMCRHVRAALPHYERRKWHIAESNCHHWAPGMYRQIGIDPRIFNRPGEIDYFPLLPDQWDWGELELMMFELDGGHLATFRDGGHLWISDRHPEGSTKCLKCGSRECGHWWAAKRELAIVEQQSWLKGWNELVGGET